jgi:hypothetical protein
MAPFTITTGAIVFMLIKTDLGSDVSDVLKLEIRVSSRTPYPEVLPDK